MLSIAILTGNHLCHNPRVIKEAVALKAAGYEVEVLGGWFDPALKKRDKELAARLGINFVLVLDFTDANNVQRLGYRIRNKLGFFAHHRLSWENTWQLGYVVSALRCAACRHRADLIICHSEAGLVAAYAAMQVGKRVAMDMEDWFSEDLLPEARNHRPLRLLRSLEQSVLRGGAHSSCPSQAMRSQLAVEYGCRPPTVIYNAFEWSDRRLLDGELKDRRDRRVPSVHWYSQTLGWGRGLEDLFAALPHVGHDMEVHLRGRRVQGFEEWVTAQVPAAWRGRIITHDLVSNEDLLSRIVEHDIGFAGEMKFCRNRDLTVTNKILHYLLGGLAVVASDTAGQKEVAAKAPNAVFIYPSGDAYALAAHLNLLLESKTRLSEAKEAAVMAAKQEFCWEWQAPKLVASVERALAL